VRRLTGGEAHADVEFRLPEIDRLRLGMHVGDVDQRHVAEIARPDQVVLRQNLLGREA
jgi:hypothetical protein